MTTCAPTSLRRALTAIGLGAMLGLAGPARADAPTDAARCATPIDTPGDASPGAATPTPTPAPTPAANPADPAPVDASAAANPANPHAATSGNPVADPNATTATRAAVDPNAAAAPHAADPHVADPNAAQGDAETLPPAGPAKRTPLRLLDADANGPLGGSGTEGMLAKTLGAGLAVLILGGVAAVVAKKVMPRLQAPGGKKVRVLETTYLGPRKTVHLLAVGGREYLVASTRDRVSMLAEVSGSFANKLDTALADQDEGDL